MRSIHKLISLLLVLLLLAALVLPAGAAQPQDWAAVRSSRYSGDSDKTERSGSMAVSPF